MSRGGRGYPRGGSHRGGSSYRGGGSSYHGSSSHSTSYSDRDSSRNRYGYDSKPPRYQESSSDRYSSRTNDSYKRTSSYKDSRDRRSPDRKRPRHDSSSQGSRRDYNGGGSSSGGYHGGSSSSRYENGSSSYDKRDSRLGSRSSSGAGRSKFDRSDSRGRSDDSYRHKESMGPPRSLPARNTRPTRSARMAPRRGSVRGGRIVSRFRTEGRRGIGGGRIMTRRQNDARPPLNNRRRFTTLNRARDMNRRLKLGPRASRSSLVRRALAAAKESGDEESDKEDTAADKTVDTENGEEADEKVEKSSGEAEEAKEDAAKEKVKEEKCEKEVKTEAAAATESDEKSEEPPVKKAKAKPKITAKEDEKEESKAEVDEEKSPKKETIVKTKYSGKAFIKLTCVHCAIKCVTFKEYATHLYSGRHKSAMRQMAVDQRNELMEMRGAQRSAQKDVEEKADDTGNQRPSYCMLCRLNYRQPKAVHQLSEAHRKMKKFLMPNCKPCKITFKSPMAFETHRCSIEHIRTKARLEKYAKDTVDEDGTAIDLENFTTVDSVGDVDDPVDTAMESKSDDENSKDQGSDGEDDDLVTNTVIGAEHVTKVEVFYCDLCRMYLPRKEEHETALKRHCSSRSHLRLFIRYRDDKKLREQAERIHKKKQQDEKEAKTKKDAATKGDEEKNDEEKTDDSKADDEKATTKEGATDDADAAVDDQMWQVVDNDLGDLLREVGADRADVDDEEEDEDATRTNSERFDKFKHTEKNGINNHHTSEEEEIAVTNKKIKLSSADGITEKVTEETKEKVEDKK